MNNLPATSWGASRHAPDNPGGRGPAGQPSSGPGSDPYLLIIAYRVAFVKNNYSGVFRTVRVVAELRNRHYEIPIEADVIENLEARARKAGVTSGHLASDLLRRQLSTSA